MNDYKEFELKITIDLRGDAYALLIKYDNKTSLTFYDTVTEAKNALSTILLDEAIQ